VSIDNQTRERIAQLLGREPRGLEGVPVVAANGDPAVIRVASLVDDKPFPTLFWLVDAELCYRIDQAEASGLIARLQAAVDADPGLQASMRDDHERHIALRDSYISAADRQRLMDLGFGRVLASKGIGGLGRFDRIRCLHTWYAAHLVEPNAVGRLLEAYWEAEEGGD
jgi:hypothetical protein